jgi:hypothetical protein
VNDFRQTYRLDRLYHKLLRPKGIDVMRLDATARALMEQGFIEFCDYGQRYMETEKLLNRKNKKELFKLIEKIRKEEL